LFYKNSFWQISSAHDLLSFLRAAPKGQSSSSDLSNFTKLCQLPKSCEMLGVIIQKRHYLSEGHWSLQLMGPLVNNHLFSLSSESQIKLKARLDCSTKKTWCSLSPKPSDSTCLTSTHLNTSLWKDRGCSHTALLGTGLVT